jgi:hypothetical protein
MNQVRLKGLALLICLLAQSALQSAQALPLPAGDNERSCWLQHTRQRTRPGLDATSVTFSNLGDGFTLRAPFQVNFAVRGMGMVPAGKPLQGAGHHHLLIDTRLPLNVTDKIPFSATHKHFGAGQTFVNLELPPGPHTLRLLFADHEHRPYYVYSKEIHVNVAGPRSTKPPVIDPSRFEATCEAWYQDEVSRPRPAGEWLGMANLRDGEPVASPVSVHFGVEGFGVCAVGQTAKRSGHFILQVVSNGKTLQTQDLKNGATQATLALPKGQYLLRLRLVDNESGRDLLPPIEHSLPVNAQERM